MLQSKDIIGVSLTVGFILLLPLTAMQFTDEVNWSLADFAVAGELLFGAGIVFKLAVRKTANITYRLAAGVAVATVLLLVWMNLAVGLIGSEDNAANLMYFGVLVVGITGAIIARFQPLGMARALFMTALAQAMIAVIALIAGMHHSPGGSISEIVSLNGFFVALFVASALLFRHAAGPKAQQFSTQ